MQGHVVKMSLIDMVNMCVSGTTGSGKTTALRAMIAGMAALESPYDLQFDIIDMKGELRIFKDLPHVRHLTSDTDESVKLLETAKNEIDRRNETFQSVDTFNLIEYNEVTDEPMSRLVIVIDELAILVMKNKEVKEQIAYITTVGRSCGVHIVIGTQSPRADILTKSNIPTIMAFHTTNADESTILIGGKGCETLIGNGDGILRTSKNDRIRFQGCFVSTKEIKALVATFPPREVYGFVTKQVDLPVNYDKQESLEESVIIVNIEKEKDDYIKSEIIEYFNRTRKALSIDKIRSEYNVGTSRASRLRKEAISI